MLSEQDKEHYRKIINDPNCALSQKTQKEISEVIEKSDKEEFELCKQNVLASESTIFSDFSTQDIVYNYKNEINNIFDGLNKQLDASFQGHLDKIQGEGEDVI